MPDDAKACSNCGWPAEDWQEHAAGSKAADSSGSDTADQSVPVTSGSDAADRPAPVTSGSDAADRTGSDAADSRMYPESSDNGDQNRKDDQPERMPWDVLPDQHAQGEQSAENKTDHSSVGTESDQPKEKFDIPWDPEEADREKARAKKASDTANVENGGQGVHGENGSAQNQNQGNTDSSEQATGYWFQGKWHPLTDLDSGTQEKNPGDSGSSDNHGNGWSSWNTQNGPVFRDGSYDRGNDQGYNRGNNGGLYYNWNNPSGSSFGGQGYPPRTNNFAVAAITMAVISVFLNSLYCIPSVLGIVFAVMALQQMKKNPGQYKGREMAIAALVISIVLLVIYVIIFIKVAMLMQDPAFMQQIENYLKQLQGGSVSSSSSTVPTQVASIFRFR